MSHLGLILEAMEQGATTTKEIEGITGIPSDSCSARLNVLKAMGLVEIAKRHAVKYNERGHWCHIWRLTKKDKP